jgi:amino acid transporter
MTHKNDKVLSLRDVVLYTISAILLVDQIAMSAAVGPLAIFWWIVILLFFFIPNTLVTAELGATYPEQGGIYAWVKTAFGARWGARVTWLYWINIVLWMPSVFIMFSGIFTVLYMPEMTLWSQIILCILLCWVVVFINCIDLNKSKWIPNVGTPIKFVIFLVLGGFGINYGIENGFANDVNVLNGFSDLAEGLAFIPVIVYGCLGVELICWVKDRINFCRVWSYPLPTNVKMRELLH